MHVAEQPYKLVNRARKHHPSRRLAAWTPEHQAAFEAIKALL